jgi:hypothetical protein
MMAIVTDNTVAPEMTASTGPPSGEEAKDLLSAFRDSADAFNLGGAERPSTTRPSASSIGR